MTPKTGLGDAELGGAFVEVKKATAATLNQVRAVKYIPLVAYHEPTDTWYVVPAHVIVCLVASKGRGQHTENLVLMNRTTPCPARFGEVLHQHALRRHLHSAFRPLAAR